MTTLVQGSTYCDACLESYFWNSLYWKDEFNQDLVETGAQCVDCCVRCEDVCDVKDEDDCVACNNINSSAVLESLDVKRGWLGPQCSRNDLAMGSQ